MTEAEAVLARRFKIAALLVSLGLAIEALTLFWAHPTSFLAFLVIGGTLVVAGVLLYLFSIVSYTTPPR